MLWLKSRLPTSFHVPNSSTYSALDMAIEPDASTASYFAAAAAIVGGHVTLRNVSLTNALQGDVQFLRLLEMMGCKLTQEGSSTTVEGPGRGSLRGINVDMGDISDTVMTLACTAPYATTPTTIRNIAHVRNKESDRTSSLAIGLRDMGIRVERTDDSLTIFPAALRER